jgi:hypothetical protein
LRCDDVLPFAGMPDPGQPSHPSQKELRGVLLDEVSQERGLEIADHLDAGCEECAMAMLAELGGLLYGPDEPLPPALELKDLDIYDQAIDRAVQSSLRIARRTRREQSRIPDAVALLDERGSDAFLEDVPRRLGGIAGLEALLAKSGRLRVDSRAEEQGGGGISESRRLAGAAVAWADRLPSRRYGLRQVRDLQCRAWLGLAEASGRSAAARRALAEAARLFLDGTGDAALEVRLLETQAALEAGSHPAGRALVSRGMAAGLAGIAGIEGSSAGRLEEAAGLIGQGLALLDRERDPALVVTAVHSLLHILVGLGRFRETRALLFEYRPAFQAAFRGGRRPH